MAYVWSSGEHRYVVDVLTTQSGGFTWRLSILDEQGNDVSDSREQSRDEFDTADEAESAGKARMLQHARMVRE